VTDDPERMVADALRAHAARTPLPAPADPTNPSFGGYRLLSGSGMAPLAEPTLRVPVLVPPDHTTRIEAKRQVAVGWIILLAVLLGLASGAVVGLLTLL
jgi:hypothetical protein